MKVRLAGLTKIKTFLTVVRYIKRFLPIKSNAIFRLGTHIRC
jgi:hypothetical protein